MVKYKSKIGKRQAIKYKPEDVNPWITYFRNRIHKKNNCINCIVTGLPGEGKSWACLSQLSSYDPNFDIDTQVFFSASKMFEAFNTPEYFAKKGKCIMFDEAGADFNNVNWRNAFNRGLRNFLQTGRHRNYILMINVPFLTDVSKGVRELMNCRWMAEGWKENKTIISPRTMQYNDDKDKFYYKKLLVRHPDVDRFCKRILLQKPPEELVNQYQKMKTEFTSQQTKKDAELMKVYEKKQEQELNGMNTLKLTYLQEELLENLKEGMTAEQIANNKGCRREIIYERINSLRKKGIKIQSKIINHKSEGFILKNEPTSDI